jgi:hypothetical protein
MDWDSCEFEVKVISGSGSGSGFSMPFACVFPGSDGMDGLCSSKHDGITVQSSFDSHSIRFAIGDLNWAPAFLLVQRAVTTSLSSP